MATALFTASLGMAACGNSDDGAGPASPSSVPSATSGTGAATKPARKEPVGKVVSAGGQQQWVWCRGQGSPTIVVSSGLDADSSMWSKVLPAFARLTRTCAVDRPGLGRSPLREGSMDVTSADHARELRAALLAVGEPGPYVPIGHSYAGLVVRSFAAQNPSQTVGLELLEAVVPGEYPDSWSEAGTSIDLDRSAALLGGNKPNLGDKPLMVLSAGSGELSPAEQQDWNDFQAKSPQLSKNSLHLLAPSAKHEIQQSNPSAVIASVADLIKAVRAGTSLQPCRPAAWAKVGVVCL